MSPHSIKAGHDSSYPIHKHRAGYCSGSSSDLHSWGSWFESRCRQFILTEGHRRCSLSVQAIAGTMTKLTPSKHLGSHHSLSFSRVHEYITQKSTLCQSLFKAKWPVQLIQQHPTVHVENTCPLPDEGTSFINELHSKANEQRDWVYVTLCSFLCILLRF